MTAYGFFVVSRKKRWRVLFPDGSRSEWLGTRDGAAAEVAAWKKGTESSRGRAFEEAREKSAAARAEFIAKCVVEIVTVPNDQPYQADFELPTVTFPDGTAMRFDEDTTQSTIDEYIETQAQNEHPDPSPSDFEETPGIDESSAWAAELLVEGKRNPLPDIESWSYSFPMESVAATLNDLADEGWSVVHVSEDRGLYASDVAQNMSAPVAARYLLVRNRPQIRHGAQLPGRT